MTMTQRMTRRLLLSLTLGASILGLGTMAEAQARTDFKVAWSIYVGWMPWGYAADHGIVQKWADKYGLTIEVTQFNDYVESMNQSRLSGLGFIGLFDQDRFPGYF